MYLFYLYIYIYIYMYIYTLQFWVTFIHPDMRELTQCLNHCDANWVAVKAKHLFPFKINSPSCVQHILRHQKQFLFKFHPKKVFLDKINISSNYKTDDWMPFLLFVCVCVFFACSSSRLPLFVCLFVCWLPPGSRRSPQQAENTSLIWRYEGTHIYLELGFRLLNYSPFFAQFWSPPTPLTKISPSWTFLTSWASSGSFLSCPLVIRDVEPQHFKAKVVVFHNRLGCQNVYTVMSHPCIDN